MEWWYACQNHRSNFYFQRGCISLSKEQPVQGSDHLSLAPSRSFGDTNWNRFWFGLGQGGEGIKTSALSSVLLFFYSQVLGLDPQLAGLALLLAVASDGVSDILIGAWSDNLQHRWGRRHPLMYASILPFGLSFVALFMAPDALGQWGLFVWLLVAAVFARNAMTLFVIPHYALGAELSQDYHTRTVINAWRTFFGYIGTGLVFLAGMYFFSASPDYPNGQLDPSRYPTYGAVLGATIILMVFGSTLGTHNVIPHLAQPGLTERFSFVGAFVDTWQAARCRSFAIFLGAFLFYVTGLYVYKFMEIYLGTYFWRLDSGLVFLLPVVGVVAALVATPMWTLISFHIGKKATVVSGIFAGSSVYGLLVGAKTLGFLTDTMHAYVAFIFLGSFVAAMLLAAPTVIAGSMLADIADEYELKSGLRREGVIFGAINFISKLSTGIGAQVAGVTIAASGLVARADPATVTVAMSNRLGVTTAFTYFTLAGLAALLFSIYPLSEARCATIKLALAKK